MLHKMSPNITWNVSQPKEARWATLHQRPVIAWLTGLSGSGKSSIGTVVDRTLTARGRHSMVLDGDNLRHGLSCDLGFSTKDRDENIRRAAEAARLLAEAGLIVLVSLISPLRAERAAARRIAGDIPFVEVFIDTPLRVCEARDPKGLYGKARSGLIPEFTGISSPYEPPHAPDLRILTETESPVESSQDLITMLMELTKPTQ
jgi:adenylylsulfate kinase/bifunctional enzyme CysN/CysC